MDAIQKTQKLKRQFLPTADLLPQENNPNKMSNAEFNMLCDNIEKTGITDPILVRRLPDGRHRIVGGAHRWEVAKLYDFPEVPVTIIDDPEFDDDQEKFQIVRMNVIHGKMSPDRFIKLYESLSQKYADDVMAEAFGFAEEEEYRKLVKQIGASLPKNLQSDFQKAAGEIKTIDGLTKLLNGMFSKYGNTLPHGYMIVDFGGKDSVWCRMSPATRKALLLLGKRCVDERRTIDDLLGGLVRRAASGQLESVLPQLIAESPEVEIPDGFELPTADALGL